MSEPAINTNDVAPSWPHEHMLEAAWGLIANVGSGNWETQTPEWIEAAERWRDASMAVAFSLEASEPESHTQPGGNE